MYRKDKNKEKKRPRLAIFIKYINSVSYAQDEMCVRGLSVCENRRDKGQVKERGREFMTSER